MSETAKQTKKQYYPREIYLAGECDEDTRGNAENDTDLVDICAPVSPGSKRITTEVIATMVEGYTEANARRIKLMWNHWDRVVGMVKLMTEPHKDGGTATDIRNLARELRDAIDAEKEAL